MQWAGDDKVIMAGFGRGKLSSRRTELIPFYESVPEGRMTAETLSPLAPVLGGEGSGVRGWNQAATSTLLEICPTPPHPQPLSPEYRGEGSKR
jgi:hypothetical protein